MTKTEAIDAMKMGKKVTHKYFSPDEWATMKDGMIVLEDGVSCTPKEFWWDRTQTWWEYDWSFYVTTETI